jgi:hypothetical protein
MYLNTQEDVQPYYEAYVCLARALKDDQQFQVRSILSVYTYSVLVLY